MYFPSLKPAEIVTLIRDAHNLSTVSKIRTVFLWITMFCLLMEYSTYNPPDSDYDYTKYLGLCRQNLEIALSGLDLLMPPSSEAIKALNLVV